MWTLGGATVRRKLAALSLMVYALCEANAIEGNDVQGVKRPKMASQKGCTPAIADHQARALLAKSYTSTVAAGAIARCWPPCCTMACAARSCAPSKAYLEAAGHGYDKATPLFRPVSKDARGITPDGVYRVLLKYAGVLGICVEGFGLHALGVSTA